jgi:hypothetical protein
VKYECGNLAPQQVAGKIFVVGIFFNDLQRGGRLAERVSGQSPLLQPHGYVIGPANALSGNTRSDERERLTGKSADSATPDYKRAAKTLTAPD